ncbi:alcohol dehydrogenase catalytic domain-containing protein, partial [Actinocorallia lasiicapitis]
MRALVATGYGPVEDVRIEEVPVPVAGPGQVLVRVEAVALNPLDLMLLAGVMDAALPVAFPFVPGMDVAGRIVALGEGVTGYGAGDRVVAFLPPAGCGGLAEYALAQAGPTTV